MNFISAGWCWLYFGVFLMLAELVLPGFVIFFFGLSAMTVGVLRFVFGEMFDLSWQLAAFSVLALVYLILLRRWVRGVFSGFSVTSQTDFGHEAVGRIGRVTAAIEPPKEGRVMIGDAEWTAVADSPIAVGADVKVVSHNNLTMKVEVI